MKKEKVSSCNICKKYLNEGDGLYATLDCTITADGHTADDAEYDVWACLDCRERFKDALDRIKERIAYEKEQGILEVTELDRREALQGYLEEEFGEEVDLDIIEPCDPVKVHILNAFECDGEVIVVMTDQEYTNQDDPSPIRFKQYDKDGEWHFYYL